MKKRFRDRREGKLYRLSPLKDISNLNCKKEMFIDMEFYDLLDVYKVSLQLQLFITNANVQIRLRKVVKYEAYIDIIVFLHQLINFYICIISFTKHVKAIIVDIDTLPLILFFVQSLFYTILNASS